MKDRYSINQNNQLLVLGPPGKKPLIVDGQLHIDKNNRFSYWLNEPTAWRKKYDFPSRVILEGNWRLNANYDLELSLNEARDQFKGGELAIKGDIISVDNDALVFQVKSQDKAGHSHVQLLKLTGSWQVDQQNQLSFQVKKEASPDILTLEGAWQINKNQQIIYSYEKAGLKTKTKVLNTLVFAGFWQINSAKKLVYILTRSLESHFDFNVQIESPNLYPKEGVIKYRLGIGTKLLKSKHQRVISLYGVWKFSRAVGLIFEMEYFKGEVHSLEFGAEVDFNINNEIVFRLKNETDEDLGISLTFTHRFLKQLDARVFLRLKAAQEEKGVDVGLSIPF